MTEDRSSETGCIRKSGKLLDAGCEVIDFQGIMPNPTYNKVQEGARLAKETGIDFIIAAGGGNVIDCTKVISVQALLDEDIWEMEYSKGIFPSRGIPFGAIGTAMYLLWILHHILNRRWYTAFPKGRYGGRRSLMTAVNLLLLADMLIIMASGIALSGMFPENIVLSIPLARRMHMPAAYWGFVLMSVHLGLHWNKVVPFLRKHISVTVLKMVHPIVAIYGIYAFIRNGFPSYLFLQSEFVFLDFSRSSVLFFIDMAAIIKTFAYVAYEARKILKSRSFLL